MDDRDVYLAGAVRTPIARFNGGFAGIAATELGSIVVRAALERSGIPGDSVDGVILGNCLAAGLGQNPARQAAIGAGLPATVGAVTVNKVCGSGLQSVVLAAQAIRCGDAGAIVAGGMENMTRAPYLLNKARGGYGLGNGELIDSMLNDGLVDAYDHSSMGVFADRTSERYGFTREEQDTYAIASHLRAHAAIDGGLFAAELAPVEARSGKETVVIAVDQQPSRFDEAKLRKLKPAFGEQGTATAANSSSINDGAASVVVLSGETCRSLSVAPQARILGYCSASREPEWFTLAPIDAVTKLLNKLSLTVNDIDLFEVNEAFAVVAMAAMADLEIPYAKLNIHGGAIALGHPIGASGARVLTTLIHALNTRHAKIGVAALCIGGGEAVAIAVERFDL